MNLKDSNYISRDYSILYEKDKSDAYKYAKCDICDHYLTPEIGSNSLYVGREPDNKLMTFCNSCSYKLNTGKLCLIK